MGMHNYRKHASEQIEVLVAELKRWSDEASHHEFKDLDQSIPFFILAQHATQALIQIAHAAPAIADLLAGEDGSGIPAIEKSIDDVNMSIEEVCAKMDLFVANEEEENEEQ